MSNALAARAPALQINLIWTPPRPQCTAIVRVQAATRAKGVADSITGRYQPRGIRASAAASGMGSPVLLAEDLVHDLRAAGEI
jgi:hypothetical protein